MVLAITMITDRAGRILHDGRHVVHGVQTADSAASWPPAKTATCLDPLSEFADLRF
jgi:hypothetical protein